MSWETTSDGTNTEFQSDNNYNFNFVKVQTSNSPTQARWIPWTRVKAEDISGWQQWESASMDLGQVIFTLRPMGTMWSTPYTLSHVSMSTA